MKVTKGDTIEPLQSGEAALVYRPESGFACTINFDPLGLIEEDIVLMVACTERLLEEPSFREEMRAWTAASGLRPVTQQ